MTTVRHAKRYGAVTKALLVSICILCVVFADYPESLAPDESWRFPIRLATFALFALAASVVAWNAATRFKCPECNQAIRKARDTGREDDRSLQFYCSSCDVIWDTGLHSSRD